MPSGGQGQEDTTEIGDKGFNRNEEKETNQLKMAQIIFKKMYFANCFTHFLLLMCVIAAQKF